MEERLGQGTRGKQRGKVGAGRTGRDRELEEGRELEADVEERLGQGIRGRQ